MQFRILGPLEVVDGDEPVRLAGPKQRALLALLLLRANEVVSREALIDGLWGDNAPTGAGHSLETHVSRLRKLLHNGHELVVTQAAGYMLQLADGELDLERFDRLVEEGRAVRRTGNEERAAAILRQALSLWRGAPLDDVSLESSAVGELRELEDRRLAAQEEAIDAELALGNHLAVVAELERLARLNPLRERLQAQLMLALYRSGRQVDALEAYRVTRRRFVDELGIEPGPELRGLEQAILRHDPALQPEAATTTRDARTTKRLPSRLVVLGAALAAGIAGAILAGRSIRDSSPLSAIPSDAVGAVDLHSGKIVRAVPIGSQPVGLAVAAGRVWVASLENRTISRIDPVSGRLVDVVSAGGSPTAIASGADAVWVADGYAGNLVRLDPTTAQVTNTIPLGGHPTAIAVDRNGVWVANSVLDEIQHVDPTTQDVRDIPVGPEPDAIAVSGSSVWVANGLGHTLTRIDSATADVVQRAIPLRAEATSLAFYGHSLWVAEPHAGVIARIDASTSRPESSLHIGGSPASLTAAVDGVWVADGTGKALLQLAEVDDRVVRTVEVGSTPGALESTSADIWIATTPPG